MNRNLVLVQDKPHIFVGFSAYLWIDYSRALILEGNGFCLAARSLDATCISIERQHWSVSTRGNRGGGAEGILRIIIKLSRRNEGRISDAKYIWHGGMLALLEERYFQHIQKLTCTQSKRGVNTEDNFMYGWFAMEYKIMPHTLFSQPQLDFSGFYILRSQFWFR